MAPAGAKNCRCGDLTWHTRGKKTLEQKKMIGNFWKTRMGRTGGKKANCGGRADGRTWGKREADGRTGGGWAADGRTGGRADGRMRADGAWTERTSGRADK